MSQATGKLKTTAALRSLEKQGMLESDVQPSVSGPPRKYYRIAAAGRKQLADWETEWERLSHGVKAVLNGGERG